MIGMKQLPRFPQISGLDKILGVAPIIVRQAGFYRCTNNMRFKKAMIAVIEANVQLAYLKNLTLTELSPWNLVSTSAVNHKVAAAVATTNTCK